MSYDINGKPLSEGKCRACGRIWKGSLLIAEPTRTQQVWTCGDIFCGGTCDLIPSYPTITIPATEATEEEYNASTNEFGTQSKVTLLPGTLIYCSNQYLKLTETMEVEIIDRDYSFYRVYYKGLHLGYLHRQP
jgi:hypothetical protein